MLGFACKSETFRSLYSHALLILTKSSKSKNQVVDEPAHANLSELVRHWTLKPVIISYQVEPHWMQLFCCC